MGRHSLVSKVNDYLGSSVGVELRYTNTEGARVWVFITTWCGSMLGLGMRLPKKSRDKTRTLHACVLGDCLMCVV